MNSLYRDVILDHYQNPRFRGELPRCTIREHGANPLCGDDLTIDLLIDEKNRIQECGFHGHGCAISQAAADLLCAEIRGRGVTEIMKMSKEEMLDLLGIALGPVRLKCGLLAFKIVKLALVKHESRGGDPS